MQVWNVLHAARWKYRTQKWRKKSPSGHHRTTLSGWIFASQLCIAALSIYSLLCEYFSDFVEWGPAFDYMATRLFAEISVAPLYVYCFVAIFGIIIYICCKFSCVAVNAARVRTVVTFPRATVLLYHPIHHRLKLKKSLGWLRPHFCCSCTEMMATYALSVELQASQWFQCQIFL